MKTQTTAVITALLIMVRYLPVCAQDDSKIRQPLAEMSIDKLIADLGSIDGKERTLATAEIFRRGKDTLPALRNARAKQIAPTGGSIDGTGRLNIVFSLLEGLPPNQPKALEGYRTDGFGLHVEKRTTVAEVKAMGEKYGFSLDGDFSANSSPNCYVRIKNKSLTEVLIRLLSEEPRVISLNLNYFVR